MRIGVVTTSYPRQPGEAAGNFVAAHVAALRELGHHIEVIAAGEARGEPHVTRVASPLFYGAGAPDELELGGAWRAAASFSWRLAAATIARARSWDRIIAHWLAPSALAALPARTPLLAIAHGGDVHTLRRTHLLAPVLFALRARNAKLAFVTDELLAIARAAAPRLASWLDSAAIVQPMGVALPALAREPARPPFALVVARLVPVKGVDVAIRALERLRTPLRLAIAGDGPLRDALARLVSPSTHVEFLGAISADDRDRLLRAAAVVVVSSRTLANGRSEGMPMIALEALAAGAPVVASAVGGLTSLAPEIALVPPDDPDALAAAIDRVIAAPPLPADLRARVAELAWPKVATRLLAHGG